MSRIKLHFAVSVKVDLKIPDWVGLGGTLKTLSLQPLPQADVEEALVTKITIFLSTGCFPLISWGFFFKKLATPSGF